MDHPNELSPPRKDRSRVRAGKAHVRSEVSDESLLAWSAEATNLRAALDEHATVAITDLEGLITFVNDKFCALSQYSREDLLGQDHCSINGERDPKVFSGELGMLAQGGVWRGEIEHRAKDGTPYWVATTIVPIPDKLGKPCQFLAIGSDITEQKRAEAELAENLRLQRVLADLSSRFVAVQPEDVDAAIKETQRLIVETLGLDRSILWQAFEQGTETLPMQFLRNVGWAPSPSLYFSEASLPWSCARVMRGEVTSFSSLNELPTEAARDAETFRIHGTKSKVIVPLVMNNRVFGALAFATVGAERKWREDEIIELKLAAQIIGNAVGRQRAELREEQLRSELAHAMRVTTLGELIAALAHELNQPLAAILSNAQAARRFLADGEINPAELTAILDDMVRDDKRAGNVIHNLRAMISKRPAVREVCCLNELVHEMIELMRSEMMEAKIEVRLSLGSDLPLVEAVRVELQQVLVNLLLNAAHAMEGTPRESRIIEVETRAEAKGVMVLVRDRGRGIVPAQLAAIFEPFFSTKASGLGMGLSICRRIIENHAGHIEAGNHDDGGAIFSFVLPCGRPAAASTNLAR